MSGGLEAIDAAVLGVAHTPENLEARRHAVGVMIGIQALLIATGAGVAVEHEAPQPAPSLIVQLEQSATHAHAHHHIHHHAASHHAIKPTHKVESTHTPASKPSDKPSHPLAPTHPAKAHIKAQPLTLLQELTAKIDDLKGRIGADISWPNKDHLVPDYMSYGIVGINYGHNFSLNPHLVDEATRFPAGQVELYVNSDFAGTHVTLAEAKNAPQAIREAHGTARQIKAAEGIDEKIKRACPVEPDHRYNHKHPRKPKRSKRSEMCVAKKAGELAGRLDVILAEEAHVYDPRFNVDAEFMRDQPWTHNEALNRANVKAEIRGIEAQAEEDNLAEPREDIYSTGYMFGTIFGKWVSKHKAWAARGHVSVRTALQGCKDNFTGAGVRRVQFVADNLIFKLKNNKTHKESLDIDINCPQ